MTGGTVDFGSLPFTWLHIISSAGIITTLPRQQPG